MQIKLKAPLTPFLQYLAHQSLFVYSPDALKKYGKDMVKHPVGTGPFKLETWEPGVKVVLARNDQYWGGAPKIRQAIYVPIIEAQARLAAIKTGEIDLTIDVPPDSLDGLRKDPNVVVAETNSSAVWYVALNTRHPILKDKRVRQAMNYAVQQGRDHPRHPQGHGDRVDDPAVAGVRRLPRGQDASGIPTIPEKAKALLKEAGFAERLRRDVLRAGVRLRHAVARRDGHRDPGQPGRGGRARQDPDHGVGRLPQEVPRRAPTWPRCRGTRRSAIPTT